jgi:hypothetical protein
MLKLGKNYHRRELGATLSATPKEGKTGNRGGGEVKGIPVVSFFLSIKKQNLQESSQTVCRLLAATRPYQTGYIVHFVFILRPFLLFSSNKKCLKNSIFAL